MTLATWKDIYSNCQQSFQNVKTFDEDPLTISKKRVILCLVWSTAPGSIGLKHLHADLKYKPGSHVRRKRKRKCKWKRKRKEIHAWTTVKTQKCKRRDRWKIFHFFALTFALAFAFHTSEPVQRKREWKRNVNTPVSSAILERDWLRSLRLRSKSAVFICIALAIASSICVACVNQAIQ